MPLGRTTPFELSATKFTNQFGLETVSFAAKTRTIHIFLAISIVKFRFCHLTQTGALENGRGLRRSDHKNIYTFNLSALGRYSTLESIKYLNFRSESK